MPHTLKKTNTTTATLEVTVPPSAYEKHLEAAARRIGERTAVKGFRKGKVPPEILKREIGDMAILQEALEAIVQGSYYEAVTAEALDTIGMPEVKLQKVAPGNDIVYSATVALMPNVKLPNLENISIAKKRVAVDEKKLDETLEALRGMHATEAAKIGVSEQTDKLVIDMEMTLDRVLVEGGGTKNHQVYLSEEHYIPGFNEALIGLKKDDEKTFALDFPPTHYQKMLAGKKVDVAVKVKEVFARHLPELSDEFAKKLGQESLEKLRDLIRSNLLEEATKKADQQTEIELFDALIAAASFDPIPDVIVNAEKKKMFYELKQDLERHGVAIEDYLRDIKKKEDELFRDFAAQAEKRAKAALLGRQVAKEQALGASPEEIEKEIALMKEAYRDNPAYLDRLGTQEVRDAIATMIQNRKVIEWLKKQLLKET